jgi:hypothetical protein
MPLPWQEVATQTYTAGSLAHKAALGFPGAAAPLEALRTVATGIRRDGVDLVE